MDLHATCSGPVRRRGFLQAGSLLLGGLGLTDLLRMRAHAEADGHQPADTAVILLWLEGGPSHMETYDMKPDAPSEYRGEFSPIATRVPGMDVCELMPRHPEFADRMTFIRSITHEIADHPGGAGRFLSGRTSKNISAFLGDNPTFDVVVGKVREQNSHTGIPQFVSNKPYLKGGGTAYLGPTAQPFVIDDPSDPNFEVANLEVDRSLQSRLDDRLQILNAFDRMRRGLESDQQLSAQSRFHQRAVEMLSSTAARDAFDLSREPNSVRDRYGRTTSGQGALIARRLVEAGCSMVTLDWGGLAQGGPSTWDDHGDAQHIFKSMKMRLPIYDQAVTALIDDIYQRGLDKRVLVIATGEFGRTPKVNMGRAATPKWPGRDHWPGAMSVMVSGGGWKMGQAIGSTTSKGEYPLDRKLDPNDFLATVYRFLGIDPEEAFLNQRGRPIPILPHGEPISELL